MTKIKPTITPTMPRVSVPTTPPIAKPGSKGMPRTPNIRPPKK